MCITVGCFGRNPKNEKIIGVTFACSTDSPYFDANLCVALSHHQARTTATL
jgi:hypothetical protein